MGAVFLDACVLIYAVEGPAETQVRLRTFFRDPSRTWASSELVRFEVLSGALRKPEPELVARHAALLSDLSCVFHPISRSVAERAAALRASHRLKPLDALHVATALVAGCTHFATNDRRLGAALGPMVLELVGAS